MIPSDNNRNRYEGNGSTTVFDYGFKVSNKNYIKVQVSNSDDTVIHELTVDSNYSVDGLGEESGGEVTLGDMTAFAGSVILPANWFVTLTPNYPQTQETDLINQGPWLASSVEDSLDHITMLILQLQEEVDRAPKVSQTSGDTGDAILTSLQGYATAAANSASDASTYASNAQTYQNNAQTYQNNAQTYQNNAQSYANQALAYLNAANLPSSIVGHANQFLQVKADETSYEFVSRFKSVQNEISALEIDCDLGNTFYKTIGVNSIFTFSNFEDGITIDVLVTASGAFTATFPVAVQWLGGVAPTQTPSGTDLYSFKQINGTIYGAHMEDLS